LDISQSFIQNLDTLGESGTLVEELKTLWTKAGIWQNWQNFVKPVPLEFKLAYLNFCTFIHECSHFHPKYEKTLDESHTFILPDCHPKPLLLGTGLKTVSFRPIRDVCGANSSLFDRFETSVAQTQFLGGDRFRYCFRFRIKHLIKFSRFNATP
jgi:hypothetical protein